MLSDKDRDILDFEQHASRSRAVKEDAILTQLGMTPIRYYQRLNRLIDTPEAAELYPAMVVRLRRLRLRRGSNKPGID